MGELIIFLVLFFSIILQMLFIGDSSFAVPLGIIQLGLLLFLWFRIRKHRKNNTNKDIHKDNVSSQECNKKVLQVMGLYRHDWQNHLQVILGYIQLKKHDQIIEYITKISHMAKNRSIISNISNENLAVFLYTFPVEYPLLSHEVGAIQGIEKKITHTTGALIHKTLQRLIDTIYKEIPFNQEHHLIMSLGSLEERIIVTIEFEGNLTNVKDDFIALRSELQKENSDLIIDIENEEEMVMEISFPIN